MENIEQENVRRNKLIRNVFGAVVLIFILLSSAGIGYSFGKRKAAKETETLLINNAKVISGESQEKNLDFSLFWDVWERLKEKHVDAAKLDAKKLMHGAIKGMLQATGDPYSNFFDPEENQQFKEEISGSFEGIGAEVGMKNGILTIIAPLKDAPAEKAGLRAGDKVIKINNESTLDMSIDEAVRRMRGTKGTEVVMIVIRDNEEKEIKIMRDVINVKSVKLSFKNEIPIVEISRFGYDTQKELGFAAKEIFKKNPKGIILDLRNDPGGFLDTAVSVASKMLPKGKVVVIEEDSQKRRNEIKAEGGDSLSHFRTVVLINEGSASAAEILAAALRENRDNVTLVGKKSFGKGSVQEMINLSKSTAVKITVARWLTPLGKQIDKEGISPDIEVDLKDEDFNNDRDPQLDKALEILK